jgi:hypothetical protein
MMSASYPYLAVSGFLLQVPGILAKYVIDGNNAGLNVADELRECPALCLKEIHKRIKSKSISVCGSRLMDATDSRYFSISGSSGKSARFSCVIAVCTL